MKKKEFRSGLSLLLAAAMVSGSLAAAAPVKAAEVTDDEGTVETADNGSVTYYIDAAGGNDDNSGTSENQAWKTLRKVTEENLKLNAGDQLLLKAGSTWNDEKLFIQNAVGEEGNPVIIGRYGEGADPLINGNGNPWNDDKEIDSLNKEDVAAVHIQNSEYIIIQNLHVTNWEHDEDDLMSDTASYEFTNKQSKSMLTGILVENHDAGQLDGVVIQNNHVENVNGWMSENNKSGEKKGSGGIMALVTGNSRKSYFRDLKILGNEVNNVCHEAIYMESCWAARTLVGGAGSQQAGAYEWVGWPDVYVANNYVHEVAGDGIVVINADGGIAEHNLVVASAKEDWYYGRNPAHAALWMWDSNNVTMQYNEAAYTESTQDGMAFDSDYGNQNILYQYNYSHNNKGGFWMACPGPYYSLNSVVRYNLSVNDAGYDGGRIIHVGESGSIGHQVYNNTIYWDADYEVKAVEQGSWISGSATAVTSGTDIYNNIFYGSKASFVDNAGTTYNNNCVWGDVKEDYLASVNDANAIIADPKFTDITSENWYTGGSFADGKVTLGKAEGLKLTADSPCINTGVNYMEAPQESFPAVDNETVRTHIKLEYKDYDGNPVQKGSVDIGAYEYQGEVTAAPAADKSYLQALVQKAESYEASEFVAASWKTFAPVLAAAQGILNRENASQGLLDSYAERMEAAMLALEHPNMPSTSGGEGENIIAGFNSSDSIDNAAYEKEESSWTVWQTDISQSWVDAVALLSISGEQNHTAGGSKSLELKRGEGTGTVYADLDGIPVETDAKYVCEAWFYCSEDDASKAALELTHGDNRILLVNASEAEVVDGGWRKVVAEFTAPDASLKISLHNSSDNAVYLDDLKLSKASDAVYDTHYLDAERNALKETIESAVPSISEADCTRSSWKNYQDALLEAKVERVNSLATADSLAGMKTKLQNALAALRGNDSTLKSSYQSYAAITQGNYTKASWDVFQNALKNAKTVLDQANATQTQIDAALNALISAKAALVTENTNQTKVNQVIELKNSSYSKKAGDAAFTLGVKLKTGNGSLTFASSDAKVAAVTNKGKVTIKGAGACKITVTATETGKYNKASAEIVVKVSPKQAAIKSVKVAKGKKMTVKWTKDANATGYEIQYSLNSKFKSKQTKTVKKASTTSLTIKKLKAKKRYYVRIRAYKNVTINGKTEKLNGAWSKAIRSAKTKK